MSDPIITEAKWTGDKELDVAGFDFKDSPSETDVEIKSTILPVENAFLVNGFSVKYSVTTLLVAKGDPGAEIRVMGKNGAWSTFKPIVV